MKVAYLFGSLNRGGLETLMLDVCRKLDKSDFDAVALCRKDGILKSEFDTTTVPFIYLPKGKNIFIYLCKLRKYLLKEKVNIAHAQQPLDALLAYFALLGTSIKVVLTLHGFDTDGTNRLLSFILKKTDANLYVSVYQKNYYYKKYKLNPKYQHVIYNGIDFSKLNFLNNRHPETLRKEFDIEKDTLLLGMVGNFNFVRNQFFICQFLKVLKEKNVDFHFIFVGGKKENSAERYDRCVEFCKQNGLDKNVSFLGVRDDVPDILSQLDAFIYATEHDTFGIAIVEAIASGIPVFVNDWEVMEEVTENGKFATLFKTNDTNDLLEKIMLFFLHNKDAFKKNAVDLVSQVREKYSIEKYIENLKELYHSL